MIKRDPKFLIRIARESGGNDSAEPLNLGVRVRDLRKAHNWTLEQTAQQVGLARSTLSKIENGQMSPTYDALKKTSCRFGNIRSAAFYDPCKQPNKRSHGSNKIR